MRWTRKLQLVIPALLVVTACSAPEAPQAQNTPGSVPDKPAKPVELNVLDVAGNLQLTQGMIDEFAKTHPEYVSKVNYTKATAPDMPGKLKAEQNSGTSQTHLVLTGTDGLSSVIEQKLVYNLLPDYAAKLPNLEQVYLPAANEMQKLAQNQGITVTYYPAGPLLEYNPEKVPNPPTSPQELLAWAKANPGKFQYARPANSGPGRTFLMGLPYLLGDSNPKDPEKGWDKTWAYLKELGQYIDAYPGGTTDVMKGLANGSSHIVASTTGWDINPRAIGSVPEGMKISTFKGFHWVTDAHYAVIPKGVSGDVLSANLALIKFMLEPKQQAKAYDKGYFYPGPAVKDVTLDMAPQESKDVIAKFGRAEYDKLIAENPKETSLPSAEQVKAFARWDREIGKK